MVFDAHSRAFAFFKGACTRGIYDNMKTAVENRVHRQGPSVQPSLPADVWALPGRAGRLYAGIGLGEGPGREPGRVVRERFFTPRLRVASYEELNAWLLDRCVAYAKAHKHPELADR